MPTTLCFDFGNTRKKCAVFKNDIVVATETIVQDDEATITQLVEKYQPQKSILSSVVHHNEAIEGILNAKTIFHKLNHTSTLSFTIPVGKPETVGADRLALCSAATHFYPNQNNLIIALGSCITFNFINQNHQFLGGSISPGLEMRFNALNHYTAMLPVIKPEPIFPLIGYDTKTNILSGVIMGMAKEIDGITAEYEAKFGNFNAVLTGGDSSYFVPLLKSRIFADNYFLYKGLYAISELNNQ
jgi:type III pantothenate kinase